MLHGAHFIHAGRVYLAENRALNVCVIFSAFIEHCLSSLQTSELSLVNGWISVCRFIADSAPQIAGRVVGQIAEKEAKAAQSIGAEAVQVSVGTAGCAFVLQKLHPAHYFILNAVIPYAARPTNSTPTSFCSIRCWS